MEDKLSRKNRTRKSDLFILSVLLCSLWLFLFSWIACQTKSEEEFRFLFVSDLHLFPGEDSVSRVNRAVEQINGLKPKPDFVIMGGDLIENMYVRDHESAVGLYDLYEEFTARLNIPVYSVIGNNDVVPVFEGSPVGGTQDQDGKDMFRERLGNGKTYRSFDHKGWHFVLLDSIERDEGGAYRGYIDEDQLRWLSEDLEIHNRGRPVCIALHIPLTTIFTQAHINSMNAPQPYFIVNNGTEVLRLLSDYNVKLVLQGHLHIVEELKYMDTTYLIGGSLSHAQKDQHFVHHEGFVIVDVSGTEFSWNYCPLAGANY
ncbi:MAG: metallophosphoesterase [Candidatus Aminicenantaceae bacterium]